jgi:hypothetical protein
MIKYQTTRCHNPEDHKLNYHRDGNLRYHINHIFPIHSMLVLELVIGMVPKYDQSEKGRDEILFHVLRPHILAIHIKQQC